MVNYVHIFPRDGFVAIHVLNHIVVSLLSVSKFHDIICKLNSCSNWKLSINSKRKSKIHFQWDGSIYTLCAVYCMVYKVRTQSKDNRIKVNDLKALILVHSCEWNGYNFIFANRHFSIYKLHATIICLLRRDKAINDLIFIFHFEMFCSFENLYESEWNMKSGTQMDNRKQQMKKSFYFCSA